MSEEEYFEVQPSEAPGDPKNWKWNENDNQWDFVDDETLDQKVESTIENLRDISRGIIEKVSTDRTYTATLDEAKVAVSLLAFESATEGNYNAPLNACKPVADFINAELDLEDIKGKVPSETSAYYQDVVDESDQDSNASILYRELNRVGFFERFDLETSDKLAIFMAEHLEDYEPAVTQEWSESGAYTFPFTLLHKVHMSSEAQFKVANIAKDYVERVKTDPTKDHTSEEYRYYLDEFELWGNRKLESPRTLDTESSNFKEQMYLYVVQNGLPRTLNMLRADMQDPGKEEKAREIMLYMLGNLKAKVGEKAIVDQGIDEFYQATFVGPGEYVLNRKTKQERANMVVETLEKYGINPGADVAEFAAGSGWLSDALESNGYHMRAFDRNQSLIDIAHRDSPNLEFQKFDWNSWQEWNELVERLGENSQDAIVINGRSERHFEYPFETMTRISKLLKDGGIYMSDSPDIELEGSPQAQKLENNRQFHEELGFYRPWLDKYFWHMVGAPPGQESEYEHFIESWTPSEELKILYAEANGLEHIETIEEEDYDGNGSRNLYMVFRKVERSREKDFKVAALKKVDEYFANQPKPHMFTSQHATYRD